MRLARHYKSQVEAEVSKALANDGVIDDTEFPMITRCLKDYYDEKERLRHPSTTFSEDLNAHTSKVRGRLPSPMKNYFESGVDPGM